MRGSPLLGRLPGSGAPSSHPAIHNLLSLLSRGNMQQGIFRLCSALPRMFIRFGWGRAGEGGGCQPSLSLPWLQPGRSHVVREFYIQDSWLTLHSNKLIDLSFLEAKAKKEMPPVTYIAYLKQKQTFSLGEKLGRGELGSSKAREGATFLTNGR